MDGNLHSEKDVRFISIMRMAQQTTEQFPNSKLGRKMHIYRASKQHMCVNDHVQALHVVLVEPTYHAYPTYSPPFSTRQTSASANHKSLFLRATSRRRRRGDGSKERRNRRMTGQEKNPITPRDLFILVLWECVGGACAKSASLLPTTLPKEAGRRRASFVFLLPFLYTIVVCTYVYVHMHKGVYTY